MVKRTAVILPLLQNGDPAQPSLGAFENEKLKQEAVIMHGHAPFLVVIRNVEITFGPRAAVRHTSAALSASFAADISFCRSIDPNRFALGDEQGHLEMEAGFERRFFPG